MNQSKRGTDFQSRGKHPSNPSRETNPPKPSPPATPTRKPEARAHPARETIQGKPEQVEIP